MATIAPPEPVPAAPASNSVAPTIPSRHRACVYTNPGQMAIEVHDIETPKPGPDEVLVELTHSGVCFADFALMMNKWPTLPRPTAAGMVGGHEGIGRVAAIGSHVRARKVGDRVGIRWVARACMTCPACLVGEDGVCLDHTISGYSHPGSYQQYVTAPAEQVVPVPEGVADEVAAPLLCAGVRAMAAVKKANLTPGQWLCIIGAGGGPGHVAVQIAARAFGFRVIGIDAPQKEPLTTSCGAEAFIDASLPASELAAAVKELTSGLGAHAVIVSENDMEAYNKAGGLLRFGGTMVCLGMPTAKPEPIPAAMPVPMMFKLMTISAVATGTRKDAVDVLDLAARGVVQTKVELRGMEDLLRTFKEILSGEMQGRVVLDLKKG